MFFFLSTATEWFETPPELNTKVYVTNLPLDITQDEFIEVMSKCGMIVRDQKTNKMKVKLYAEPDGQLKGDGLCHYFKVRARGSSEISFFIQSLSLLFSIAVLALLAAILLEEGRRKYNVRTKYCLRKHDIEHFLF